MSTTTIKLELSAEKVIEILRKARANCISSADEDNSYVRGVLHGFDLAITTLVIATEPAPAAASPAAGAPRSNT